MSDTIDLPNVDPALFAVPALRQLQPNPASNHPPRILLLYGSLRERSFSRLLSEEAARLLTAMGCETRTFNPHELPSGQLTQFLHFGVRFRRIVSQGEFMRVEKIGRASCRERVLMPV